ncbi:MAG: energy transducer TonB [Verrucomicrobiota bacterium]
MKLTLRSSGVLGLLLSIAFHSVLFAAVGGIILFRTQGLHFQPRLQFQAIQVEPLIVDEPQEIPEEELSSPQIQVEETNALVLDNREDLEFEREMEEILTEKAFENLNDDALESHMLDVIVSYDGPTVSSELFEVMASPANQGAANSNSSRSMITYSRPLNSHGQKAIKVRKRPTYKDCPAPSYPVLARRNKYEGRVLLKLMISSEGSVLDIDIIEGSGHEVLDQKAYQTALRWKFYPGTINDFPVEMPLVVPIAFSLNL